MQPLNTLTRNAIINEKYASSILDDETVAKFRQIINDQLDDPDSYESSLKQTWTEIAEAIEEAKIAENE